MITIIFISFLGALHGNFRLHRVQRENGHRNHGSEVKLSRTTSLHHDIKCFKSQKISEAPLNLDLSIKI